ncbi:MAG: class I SAM-dependent methyltransferase [Myxococcota bacterium]
MVVASPLAPSSGGLRSRIEVALGSDQPGPRAALVQAAHGVRLTHADPSLEAPLVALLRDPELDPDDFGPLVSSWLQAHPDLQGSEPPASRLARRPLFVALLAESHISELWLEALCLHLRRRLVRAPEDAFLPLRLALARQAHRVEHAWPISTGDRAFAVRAQRRAAASLARLEAQPTPAVQAALADASAWGPLGGIEGSQRLLEVGPIEGNSDFRQLVSEAITQPAEEARLAERVTTWSEPEPGVSSRVARQYEARPYPRWTRPGVVWPRPLAAALADLFPRHPWERWPRQPRVLVAGAGTGREALRLARSHPDCTVQAVDLSRRSLAFGLREAQRCGAVNLSFARVDLHRPPEEMGRFELIDCMGVLHHLENPRAVATGLVERLAPHGLLKLGLYSRAARVGVEAARREAKLRGFGPDPDGLRAFRAHVMDLPPFHPARDVLATRDFYSLSGLRDLCFHEHEITFGLDELGRWVSELGLELVGIIHHDPQVFVRFREMFPAPGTERDWDCWAAFEARYPRTFGAMIQGYLRRARTVSEASQPAAMKMS